MNQLIFLVILIFALVLVKTTNELWYEYNSFIEIFRAVSERYPERVAINYKDQKGESIGLTYREFYDRCLQFAKRVSGLPRQSRVCIIGTNSIYWFCSFIGLQMAGMVPVGIYFTNGKEACMDIIEQVDAVGLIVDTEENLLKFQKLYGVRFVVLLSGNTSKFNNDIPIYTWKQFLSVNGRKISLVRKGDDLATIVYTSGTTGNQKGAMITNKNVITMIKMLCRKIMASKLFVTKGERFMSYLPLNHTAAQFMEIYLPICCAGTVWIAGNVVRGNGFVDFLKMVKPTMLCCVPRVLEKIKEQTERRMFGCFVPMMIGLDKCKFLMNAGGPISVDILKYFREIGLNVYNVYGMTETSGPVSVSLPGENKLGFVGKVLPGIQIQIREGQIFVRGPTVFRGYIGGNERRGWFNTGDQGYIDHDGYLFVSGRKKDLIITSGGEKINPIEIETKILENIDIVNDAIIVGQSQKFIIALLTLKLQTNGDEPTILFTRYVQGVLRKIGSKSATVVDVDEDLVLKKYIDNCIDQINTMAISNVHKIKKWAILPTIFTVKTGELTPTMKPKREFIEKKYSEYINKLYSESNQK